jgi:hypothetical protein
VSSATSIREESRVSRSTSRSRYRRRRDSLPGRPPGRSDVDRFRPADDLPIRIAEEGHRVPNVELKFASDEFDHISLDNAISVRLGGEPLRVGSLEFQIAYKLDMGARKDYEDALYLHEVAGPSLIRSVVTVYRYFAVSSGEIRK